MKIRSQFIISLVVFGIIMLVTVTSVILTNQQTANLSAQQEQAANIQRGATNLNYLSNYYFLYQENLQLDQWHSAFNSLSNDVSSLKTGNSAQQTLVNALDGDLQNLASVFDNVVSYLQNAPRNVSVRIDPQFQTQWIRMALQNQQLATDASQLSQAITNQADQLGLISTSLVFVLFGTFGVYFLAVYLLVYRRALNSISNLQTETKIIGEGNLDHRIRIDRQDEIGELSQAFNQMTGNLKTVTASKADLEQEIAGRELAEISLRESEQRWATTLESIGDAVIATDVSGKITFMNDVAEELTGWALNEVTQKPVKQAFNIVNEHTRREVEDPVAKVLEKGLVIGLANHTILLRKDGTEMPIDDSGAPIKDKDGKITGVVLVFRDITERKKTEEKIAQQALMIATANDAIIGYDLNQKVTFWNKAAERIYGYTMDEAMGKASVDLLKPSYVNVAREELVNQLASTGHVESESIRSAKDGRRLNVEAHVILLRDESGKSIGYVSVDRDITRRKKNEAAIRESEERFSKAFHDSPVPQIITRFSDFRYVDANESVLRMLEYTREELIGHTSAELNLLVDSNKRDQGISAVREQGELRDFETKVRTKSGKIITVLTSSEAISLNGQKHLINTFIDITLRKQMQAKLEEYSKHLEDLVEKRTFSLKESEEKYRTLFESIDEGFCIVEMVFDDDGKPTDYRFLDVNSAFERQTGLLNAKGKLMRSLVPDHEAYWFEIYGKVALTGEPIRFSNEAKALNRWYDVFAFPVGEEKIRKVAILFNDITQRRNLNQQLKDSERLAAIGATAGMVGHDIRNPLQAIIGDVYLAKGDVNSLKNSDTKESLQESLVAIEKNIEYINKIVADLQDFARPLNPRVEETDLNHIINDLLTKNGLPTNIKPQFKITRETQNLTTDPAYMNRILGNLINNAIQAMPNGGKLTINATTRNNNTIITVKDTGIGIPDEAKPKLFTPLFTTKSKGQGFGLAVVKRMTEALGGTVTLESQQGKGTTFTITLPQEP